MPGTFNKAPKTQHRPKREVKPTQREKRLERENKQLARKLTKVRKELVRTQDRMAGWGGPPDPDPLLEAPALVQTEMTVRDTDCPTCKTELAPVDLGFKTYLFCSQCKYRKPVNNSQLDNAPETDYSTPSS